MKKLIGITGPLGSGKTTASKILQNKGYVQLIFSDVIKDEAKKRGLPTDTREILQDIGDELRNKYGNEVLAKKLLKKAVKLKINFLVVDGIRNIGELNYIKKRGGFIIGINSSLENRFKRISVPGEFYYGKSKKEFEKDEARDRGVGQDDFGQHAKDCLNASDIIINNNGTLKNLKEILLHIISL
ncbi:MAG TPA: AAA family ATPase [Patescibacteria group bacterium]|nr:AAA family ATPase [Patescibacteria group bacterium]